MIQETNEIKKPIKVNYNDKYVQELDDKQYQDELNKITDKTFADAGTTRTIKNIKETLVKTLKKKYGKTNGELKSIVDGLLKIHGLHEDNFDYINTFSKYVSSNINDVSIDANANKGEKSIKGLLKDLELSADKLIGYDMLYRTMKELYGQEEAKRLCGEMYDFSLGLSDSSNILIPYCFAIDASKLITTGRDFGTLPSKPSKRLSSYISALCETVHQLASHLAGAVAIGSFFTDIAHLLIYKERISLKDIKENKKIRKYIENEFQQFVHSVNFLSRNGNESPFTNISIFDKEKLDTFLSEDNYGWLFPNKVQVRVDNNLGGEEYKLANEDYKEFVKDYVFELQKIFVDFFDKGDPMNGGINYRFPVVTVNFSKHTNEETGKDELSKDNELLSYMLTKDISKYNIFTSYGTKIASCCLTSTTKVVARVDGYVRYITVKQLFDIWDKSKDNKVIEIMGANGFTRIVDGFSVVNKTRTINKITLKSGLVISTTLDHPSVKVLNDGSLVEVQAKDLQIGDMLPVSKNVSYDSVLGGDRDFGRFVGLFGAEGQYDLRRNTDIAFSFHTEEKDLQDFVVNFAKNRLAATSKVTVSDIWPNSTRVSINSRMAHATMRDFFIGNFCTDKRLRSKIFNMSYDFRIGFLEGFIEGDGHTCDNMRGDYGSIHIANKELGMDLVALANSVNIRCGYRNGSNGNDCVISIMHNDKLKLKPLQDWRNGVGALSKSTVLHDFDNYYGIQIEKIEQIKTKNGVHVYDFTVENSNHLFQIANGIITHNCRMINNTELMDMGSSVNSFGGSNISLGSHRVVTINFTRLAYETDNYEDYLSLLDKRVESAAKILKAHKVLIKKLSALGLEPFVKNGWINIGHMFSTFGVLGIVEAKHIIQQKYGTEDFDYMGDILVKFNEMCKKYSQENGIIFNVEQIPAESFGVRLADADKLIYGNPYNLDPLYANQFCALWHEATIYERLDIDGKYNQMLSGGGIVHAQIQSIVTPTQAKNIILHAVECGCEHFALNTVYSQCRDCKTVVKGNINKCPKCGCESFDHYSRVIGFFTKVEDWNPVRRDWEFQRRKFVDLKVADNK